MLYWEHGCSLQLSLIIKLASTTKNFFLPGRATWLHFDSELKFFPLYFCVAFLAVLALCCYAHFSLVAASRAYSNCGAWASHGSGFSCCRAWVPGRMGSGAGAPRLRLRLSSGGTRAWLLCHMWDLPGSGKKPVSPALAGRFFTPELLGGPELKF